MGAQPAHISDADRNDSNVGRVVSIKGTVVDCVFPSRLPAIHDLITTGPDGRIVLEVASHLEHQRVRAIAFTPTQGLARGAPATTASDPIRVPVGPELLGRMFDVFGLPIDGGAELSELPRRSVHQRPVPLSERTTSSDIFETGIKAIDVLCPLERGGKGRPLRRRRGREDGPDHGVGPQRRWRLRGRLHLLWHR